MGAPRRADEPNVPVVVYALADPETGEHFYVGCARDPAERLKSHVSDALNAPQFENRNTPRRVWIRSLLERGTQPVVVVLERTTNANALRVEDAWIRECRKVGCQLGNVRGGRLVPAIHGGEYDPANPFASRVVA